MASDLQASHKQLCLSTTLGCYHGKLCCSECTSAQGMCTPLRSVGTYATAHGTTVGKTPGRSTTSTWHTVQRCLPTQLSSNHGRSRARGSTAQTGATVRARRHHGHGSKSSGRGGRRSRRRQKPREDAAAEQGQRRILLRPSPFTPSRRGVEPIPYNGMDRAKPMGRGRARHNGTTLRSGKHIITRCPSSREKKLGPENTSTRWSDVT